MTIRDYLDAQDLTPTQFAAICKLSRTAVYRYLAGHKPWRNIAFRIERCTNGKVTAKELLGDKFNA